MFDLTNIDGYSATLAVEGTYSRLETFFLMTYAHVSFVLAHSNRDLTQEIDESAIGIRIVIASAALITLAGAFSTHYWTAHDKSSSFSVYYTAACLVRGNMNCTFMIDSARRQPAACGCGPSNGFVRTAIAHGIPEVMLYLYPPTLADLLVPLTAFSPTRAFLVRNTLICLCCWLRALSWRTCLESDLLGWVGVVGIFLILFVPPSAASIL